MAKKKAEEFIEKIETPETVAVVGVDGEPIAVSGEVPQETTETEETSDETTDIDSEPGSETAVSSEDEKSDPVAETAVSSEDEKSDPVAETADNDAPDAGTDEHDKSSDTATAKSADKEYDPFLFPVSPEAIAFAVAGTGHSHEVVDGYVNCEECHAALYPEPVIEIESYSFDASEQDS